MKMYKKSVSVLLVSLLCFWQTIPFVSAESSRADNLYEFVKNNKEVIVKYEYPSLRIASNTKKPGTVTVPAGTPIILKNSQTINSSNITIGSTVSFVVVNDVVVNDKVVVKAGSIADAQISYAKKNNYAGIAGEVVVSDFSVHAVDGTYIPLRATLSSRGEEKVGLSVGLGFFLCLLFLLIKGEDAVLPSGSTKSVYTMSDVQVKPDSL